jgi:hypothetical protein
VRLDVRLDSSPVFRNLDYRWSFYGLTLEDAPFVAMPGLVALGCTVLFDVSPLWAIVLVLASATALVALKWRKPEGYLQSIIHLALTPRRLSHKERDSGLRPFPLDQELKNR